MAEGKSKRESHIDDPGIEEDVSEQEHVAAPAPAPVSSDNSVPVTMAAGRSQEKLERLVIPEGEIYLPKTGDTVLGSGGFGNVFRGQFTRGDKPVAVKVIKKSLISMPEKRKFLKEALLMKRAQHGKVVHMYGILCSDRLGHGLVMEFMEHGSLKDFMDDVNIPFSVRIQMLWDTAEGLQYLNNEIKMAHNDIKEGNIMVDSNFNAKISDFGVANLYQQVTSQSLLSISEENQLRGTEHYIPPEMLKDVMTEPNEQTDIYSYGITMFVVLTHGKERIYPRGTKMESLIHGWRCPINEERINNCIRSKCSKEEEVYVCGIMLWVMTNIVKEIKEKKESEEKEERKKFLDMISIFNSYRKYHHEFLNRDKGILYSQIHKNTRVTENEPTITQPIQEPEIIYSRSLHTCSRTSAAPDKDDSMKTDSFTSYDESGVAEDFKKLHVRVDERDADPVPTDQNRHEPKPVFAERAATMQAQPVPVHPNAMHSPFQATSLPGHGNATYHAYPTMQAPYSHGYGYPVSPAQMPAQDPSLYGAHPQQNLQQNPVYYPTAQQHHYYAHPPPYYVPQPTINIYNSPMNAGPTTAMPSMHVPSPNMSKSASTGHLNVWSEICNELPNHIMKDWKDFLRRSLGFEKAPAEIMEIEHEHRRLKDQVHAALNAWYRSGGYNSTYQDLQQLLVKMGNRMAADVIENILKAHKVELSAVIKS